MSISSQVRPAKSLEPPTSQGCSSTQTVGSSEDTKDGRLEREGTLEGTDEGLTDRSVDVKIVGDPDGIDDGCIDGSIDESNGCSNGQSSSISRAGALLTFSVSFAKNLPMNFLSVEITANVSLSTSLTTELDTSKKIRSCGRKDGSITLALMGFAFSTSMKVLFQVTSSTGGRGWSNCKSCKVEAFVIGSATMKDRQAPAEGENVGETRKSTIATALFFPLPLGPRTLILLNDSNDSFCLFSRMNISRRRCGPDWDSDGTTDGMEEG